LPASDTVRRVKDIFPGASNSYPHLLGELDVEPLFAADNGSDGKQPLRRSGQSSNTFILKAINSGQRKFDVFPDQRSGVQWLVLLRGQ
jgi:hypothetical protein